MKYTFQIQDLNEPPAFQVEIGDRYDTVSEAFAEAIDTLQGFDDETLRTANIEVRVDSDDGDGYRKSSQAWSFTLDEMRRAFGDVAGWHGE